MLYENGTLQILFDWVLPPIDVKSVIYTDGLLGNGSFSKDVRKAWFEVSNEKPLQIVLPNLLYVSKLQINGGLMGFAIYFQ